MRSGVPQTGSTGVTVVVTRVVRPGRETEFDHWAAELDAAAGDCAGHLASVRLHDDQGLNHLVHLFDDQQHLKAWEDSPEREALIARGNELSDVRRTTADGLRSWFTMTTTSRRWKSFLLTWIAVYPILLVLSSLIKWVAPGLPQPVMLAVSSLTLTTLLTWVVLPWVGRHARPWLFRPARPERREP
jgi:antibiotic biosynthesis monooxygenase (ABM) superfamily enzyme